MRSEAKKKKKKRGRRRAAQLEKGNANNDDDERKGRRDGGKGRDTERCGPHIALRIMARKLDGTDGEEGGRGEGGGSPSASAEPQ